ncbi:MAG: hypothetical protein KDD15_29300, partial [Lewinella sp.]|nr:hypothetical protein [Lewinella sp.]
YTFSKRKYKKKKKTDPFGSASNMVIRSYTLLLGVRNELVRSQFPLHYSSSAALDQFSGV